MGAGKTLGSIDDEGGSSVVNWMLFEMQTLDPLRALLLRASIYVPFLYIASFLQHLQISMYTGGIRSQSFRSHCMLLKNERNNVVRQLRAKVSHFLCSFRVVVCKSFFRVSRYFKDTRSSKFYREFLGVVWIFAGNVPRSIFDNENLLNFPKNMKDRKKKDFKMNFIFRILCFWWVAAKLFEPWTRNEKFLLSFFFF